MAEKLLKAKRQKIATKKAGDCGSNGVAGRAVSTKPPNAIALVATYREKQLAWIRKNGVYNYPVKDGDEFDAAAFGRIKELWLYAGSKGGRHCFAAEFVGKMTREEFLAAYPTYAKISLLIKSENREYCVFKTSFLDYGPKLEDPQVLIRAMDFATGRGRARLVKKAFDQFKADGEFAPLAAYLPGELSAVPRQQLRVCEAAVQMEFLQMMYPNRTFPSVDALQYTSGAIIRHPQTEIARPQTMDGQPFRLGEFFCGPGGLACGAMSATIENPLFRIEHAWSNDYDQQTCNTYAENICHDRPETVICQDVRKLQLDDKRLTPIDGFAFGFPCNDFSVVGEHKGIDGNYGPLYQEEWFVAMNMPCVERHKALSRVA